MSRFLRLLCCMCLLWNLAVHAEEQCGLARAEAAMNFTLSRLYSFFGNAVSAPALRILQDARDLPYRNEWSVFGYYDRRGETLYVVCGEGQTDWIDVAVRHEVTHHYLAKSFGDLPVWLNEGLATYMEVGQPDGLMLNHYVNRPRLDEFVGMLKWDKGLSITELLSVPPRPEQASRYYAGYWALVFALMHDAEASVQIRRRQLLIDLLKGSEGDLPAVNRRLVEGLIAENGDLAQWELRWRRTLWDLR